MSAIEFKLDAFEGPLDLLLFLVNRHKLNIYDIEISLLLEQYLEYMDSMEEEDFDQAGEFLAMAARLVYIKTCSLLPKAEEAEELKKELEGELIEYSMCREAAARLRELCVYGDVFVRPPEKLPVNKVFTGTIDPKKLVTAYLGMSAKARSMKPVRAEQFDPIVTSRIVTVTSKIVHVLKMLYTRGRCPMSELYEGVEDKSARVATFLAVLELTKSGRVMLNEDNTEISFNRDSPRRKKPAAQTEPKQSAAEELPRAETDGDIKADTAERGGIPEEKAETEPTVITDNEREIPAAVFPLIKAERYVGAVRSGRSLSIPVSAPREMSVSEEVPAYEPEAEYVSEDISEAEYLPDIGEEHIAPEMKPEGQVQNEGSISREPFDRITDTIEVKIQHGRINRFALRYYWGYPAETGNCLPYRRERL